MGKYIPRKSKTLKYKGKPKRSKISKPTKTAKMILKRIEDKQAYTASNATFFNSGIDSAGDMVKIIPNISKGTNDNQRIGDQLTAKSFNLKGFIRFLPQPASGSVNVPKWGHIGVRMMILSLKAAGNYDVAVTQFNALNTLLKKGGTTVAFTGAISDLYADINTDVFTKHYNKVIYLNQSYAMQPSGAGNQSALAIDVSKLVKFFNIKIKMRNKILKYDDSLSSGLLPNNCGMFLCAGYVYMDGSSPDVLTTNLQVSWDTIFNYEDA